MSDVNLRGGLKSLLWRQLIFTLTMIGFCGISAVMAYVWVGPKGVEGVIVSGLLCAFPGWLTLFISHLIKAGRIAVYFVVVAMLNRMIFVLVGVLAVRSLRPDLGFQEFIVWLLVAYMVSLLLETWLVLLPVTPGKA